MLENFKNKRILFLGNTDNVNLRLCLWSRRFGLNAKLWRLEEGPRGGPQNYSPEWANGDFPDWMDSPNWLLKSPLDMREIIKMSRGQSEWNGKIENEFDLVFVSGWNALMASKGIRLPKVFTCVGYEVLHHCDFSKVVRDALKLKSIYQLYWAFYYWNLTRSALKKVNVIIDTFPVNHRYYRKFNLMDRVITRSLGDDVKLSREWVNQKLFHSLIRKTADARRIFLWLSRVNYKDKNDPSYKGVELFVGALESLVPQLKQGEVKVFMGRHGLDIDSFIEEFKDRAFFRFVYWIEHLSTPDLLTYLSLPNAVVFTEFGLNNDILSGIGRDALSMGTPTVNSTTDEGLRTQFDDIPPRLFAEDSKEILKQMQNLLDDSFYRDLRKRTEEFSYEHFDISSFIPKLYREVFEKLSYFPVSRQMSGGMVSEH